MQLILPAKRESAPKQCQKHLASKGTFLSRLCRHMCVCVCINIFSLFIIQTNNSVCREKCALPLAQSSLAVARERHYQNIYKHLVYLFNKYLIPCIQHELLCFKCIFAGLQFNWLRPSANVTITCGEILISFVGGCACFVITTTTTITITTTMAKNQ